MLPAHERVAAEYYTRSRGKCGSGGNATVMLSLTWTSPPSNTTVITPARHTMRQLPMLPKLIAGTKYDVGLAEALKNTTLAFENVRGNPSTNPMSAYIRTCLEAADQLSGRLRPAEVERLILTQTHWRIQNLNAIGMPEPWITVDFELRTCLTRLYECVIAVEEEIRRWPKVEFAIVPDTNVFLHGTAGALAQAPWHDLAGVPANENIVVVLLMPVIDELDRHKRSTKKELRNPARKALKEIDTLFPNSVSISVNLRRESVASGSIDIIVLASDLNHTPLGSTDSEIIDRALNIEPRTSAQVLFLTGDTNAAFKARHEGLKCSKIPTPDPD